MKTLALLLPVLLLAPVPASAPAPEAVPDVSRIMHVLGADAVGHACPVAPDRAITAAHVVLERPDSNPAPLRWGQTNAEMNTALVPLRRNPRDDIMLLEVLPAPVPYYPIAATAPQVGERLWWVAYDWRDAARAFAPRVLEGRVTRIVAGHLIMDVTSFEGSSGSCALNSRGEVVALVEFGKGLDKPGDEVAGLVGVWGDWIKDLMAEPRP